MNAAPRAHTATFVVSAGRCGTQWLANTLHRNYGDLVEVQHEPIEHKYCPRILLRSGTGLDAHPHRLDIVGHLDYVLDALRDRDYVETGWPAFAAIPVLRELLDFRIKVIHLTRHPVPSACSLVTHRYYQPDLRDDGYTNFAILHPTDGGVLRKDYAASWDRLSVYEKCLFHWAEIHAYGLELHNSFPGPDRWLRVGMEELLDVRTGRLAELLGFLGLPIRNDALAATQTHFDVHRAKTELSIDWHEVGNHPAIVRLAASLGYDALAASSETIIERYRWDS
jgi:hypothetical protein